MNIKSLGRLSGALLALAFSAGIASASTVTLDVSGTIEGGVGAFTAEVVLDVVGGQAVSGTGSINILGLSSAPLVLITPSTPGNESSPGPVGFRDDGGTDIGGADTAYPINNGLLFDVGTTTASFGNCDLSALNFQRGTHCGNCGRCGISLFAQTHHVLIGNFPAKLPVLAALLKALLQENRAAGIADECA